MRNKYFRIQGKVPNENWNGSGFTLLICKYLDKQNLGSGALLATMTLMAVTLFLLQEEVDNEPVAAGPNENEVMGFLQQNK